MVVDKINKMLTETNHPELSPELLKSIGEQSSYVFDRQFGLREEREAGLYLSSIGKCTRQQAYNLLGFEKKGKEIDSRARIVFYMGDIVELAVINLAKMAGCKIEREQIELEIAGVKGHPDGIITEDGVKRLLEVKSMSSYSFESFENGEIDDSYVYQFTAYCMALGLTQCVYVAMNKDSGVLGERIFTIKEETVVDIKNRINILKAATKENLPDRPYQPNEKGLLPWQCRYCAHYQTCWPNSELILAGKSYKLKVSK